LNSGNTQEPKVALVTGSGRRIGAAIIRCLHGAGYRVAIHCHKSITEAQELAHCLNTQRKNSAAVFSQDLEAADAAKQLIQAVSLWGLRLDLLVNNASMFLKTDFQPQMQQFAQLFHLNVHIPYLLSVEARPYLKHTQGSIVNITDIHAQKPLREYSLYCQTKAALAMQTQSLALEWAPTIRVNAVAPGAIAWPEQENTLSEDARNKIIAKIPLQHHGDPRYIAQAVLALAENPYITGQTINVDGGRSIR